MDFINILLVSVIVVNLMLVVMSSGPKDTRTDITYKAFLFNILTIVFWVGSMILNKISTPEVVVFTTKMLYISATFIASSFYIFVVSFVGPSRNIKKQLVCVSASNSLVVILVFLEKIIKEAYVSDGEVFILFGKLYIIYAVYILYYFLKSFIILFIKYKSEQSIFKKGQIFYIFAGYTISGMVSLFADLFWPVLKNSSLCWLGPVSTFFVSLATFYAIKRYKLFEAKVFIAELLVFILWIFSITRIISYSGELSLSGDILSVVLILVLGISLIDVTKKEVLKNDENKTLIRQLDLTNQEMKKVNVVKDRFVSLATHQMASPLTTLRVYLDFLKENNSLKREGDNVTVDIQAVLDRLISVIKDFLDVSKLENNRSLYLFENHYPEDVIEELLASKRDQINSSKLKVNFLRSKDFVSLNIDRDKFTMAVGNIVDNIIKFSKNGETTIKCFFAGDFFYLSISDCAKRVLPKTPEVLLEKFSNRCDYFEADIISNCLGLYVSRQIVESHGGVLLLHPKEGSSGCIFDIKIPLLRK